jgi:hypothetical protein
MARTVIDEAAGTGEPAGVCIPPAPQPRLGRGRASSVRHARTNVVFLVAGSAGLLVLLGGIVAVAVFLARGGDAAPGADAAVADAGPHHGPKKGHPPRIAPAQ